MKSWEFSWMCRCSLSSNSMCVCVRLGLRDSQLSALCRFLSDVSGWGTVYQRNTCANLSAHGADWHSVCPRLVGNQRERERLRGKAWEKKKPMMVGKERMSLHVDTLGRLVMFFFVSLSQFKDNWATIVLQGPIEFLHRFKSVFYFWWSVVFITSVDCVAYLCVEC